ncbi:MAG TPA: FxLYD domain-containing protein [Vicinamibacterales bacterium]|nr:FxLYD domain-containing protein [Vicinamibacterales bacterium]
MSSCRVPRVAAAALIAAMLLPVFAFGQGRNEKKLSKEEEARREQFRALARVVDGFMTGQPATGDFGLKWETFFSMKAQDQRSYVPFTVTLDPAKTPKGTVVFYLRAVKKGTETAAAGALTLGQWATRPSVSDEFLNVEGEVFNRTAAPVTDAKVTIRMLSDDGKLIETDQALIEPATLQPGAKGSFRKMVKQIPDVAKFEVLIQQAGGAGEPAATAALPYEDAAAVTPKSEAGTLKFSRFAGLPAGDYDVYVAVAESVKVERNKPPIGRAAVVKESVSVPDYWGTELVTTPIIFAQNVQKLPAPLSPEQQMERPYVFGDIEVTPAGDRVFSKQEELSLIFLIYNTGSNEAGKPDLEVDYRFHQRTGQEEKFFNRTQPQQFNATSLPPAFDVRAGHQVVGGQTIPLASFPEGEYRLEIRVNDKLTKKTLTRDVTFTVTS